MSRVVAVFLMLGALTLPQAKETPTTSPLKGVKEIQILPVITTNPDKVKNPDAPALVEKSLRRAVLGNEFQVVDSSPVKVRISLKEFTGGSFATRFIIGYGAGRSTVDCRLQILDVNEKEIASSRVRVRGSLALGAYQGNGTQTKDAVNKFDEALVAQIEKWK